MFIGYYNVNNEETKIQGKFVSVVEVSSDNYFSYAMKIPGENNDYFLVG